MGDTEPTVFDARVVDALLPNERRGDRRRGGKAARGSRRKSVRGRYSAS